MSDLRIVFMGTAPLACASLQALSQQAGFRVVAVVTQPDRPKGRELKRQPSAVKELALRLGLPVLQPEKARHPAFLEEVRALEPDLIALAAYGQLLPASLLDLPRFGSLNVHTSLLPKYRGAAPIQWAILDDNPETGVTIMKMDAGLDTGPIVSRQATPIQPEDNAQTLHDRLAVLGAELLVGTIPDYVAGNIVAAPQPLEGVSLARKISKEDGRLDWAQPARALWNRVRGLTPWPGAFTFQPGEPAPRLLKVWRAEVADGGSGQPGEVLQADKAGVVVGCGRHALRLLELQREGGKRLAAREFLAGHAIPVGTRLL